MPQSNNDQTGSPVNQQSQSIEKRNTQLEDTQRVSQDARLREQAFDATRADTLERSQDKRKRLEIAL